MKEWQTLMKINLPEPTILFLTGSQAYVKSFTLKSLIIVVPWELFSDNNKRVGSNDRVGRTFCIIYLIEKNV